MTSAVRTLGGTPNDVIFSADGTRVYTSSGSGVAIFSTTTGALLTSYTFGSNLAGMDLLPDGHTLVIASTTTSTTAQSGTTTQSSDVFYTLDLNTGVSTSYNVTLINGGGFYDVAALSNGKVVLTYATAIPTGTVPLLTYDLGTGTYTQDNAPSTTGMPSFGGYPPFYYVGILDVSAGHSGIFATQAGQLNGNLATIAASGGVTGTGTFNSPATAGGIMAISVAADRVIQGNNGKLQLFDSHLAFLGDIAPAINAAMGYGSLSAIAFSNDGTKLYGVNPTTGIVYAFSTSDWHILQTWATGTVTDPSKVGGYNGYGFGNKIEVSPDGHYLTVVGQSLQLIDLTVDGTAQGTSGNDTLAGTASAEVIYGYNGNDTLIGNGTDVLIGGLGNDTYIVNDTKNVIIEDVGGGDDTMITTVAITAADNVENLVLAAGAIATITAGSTGTRLVGNDFGTALVGGAGVDIFVGGRGDDVLTGGSEDSAIINASLTDSSINIAFVLTRALASYHPTQTITIFSADGIDTVNGVGTIKFNDGTLYFPNLFEIDQTILSLRGRHATMSELATISAKMPTLLTFTEVRTGTIAALHGTPTDDFNGDGRSDILWRNADGTISTWLSNASGGFASNDGNALINVSNAWHIVDTGDFNGDGRSDILWRSDSGQLSNWLGTAAGGFTPNDSNALTSVPLSWHVAHVGDFNGDGRDDILWRNDNGQLSDWLGTASGGFTANDANAFTTVSLGWHIADVGDFNGDGRSDILWRNDNGMLSNWLGTATGGFTPNDVNALQQVSTSWKVIDTGDFNGDGRTDILWRNDDGRISDWLGTATGGFTPNDANAMQQVPLNWTVVDTGDYNGDGRDDILWRNSNGDLSNWLGTTAGGFVNNDAHAFNHVDSAWAVQVANYQVV